MTTSSAQATNVRAGNLNDTENDIRGRLALVTGASGGIGWACATQLWAAGVDLALTYSSNTTQIVKLREELLKSQEAEKSKTAETGGAQGEKAGAGEESVSGEDNSARSQSRFGRIITIHKANLSNVEEVQELCEQVKKEHGRGVDILVSNAGIGRRITQIWDISLQDFEDTININLRAAFLLVKGTVEHMRDQKWGRIIFVSSIAAYGAGVNGCHYAASKGGLTALMKNLASRLGEYNISVNDVAPAMIERTGMIPSSEAIPGVKETIPLQRLGQPEEVANAVLMYARTGYVTGQSLVIAGGLRYL